jgi:hypothetical protein
MPKLTVSRREKMEKEKSKAVILYKSGFSLREVAKLTKKSHEWVRKAVNEKTELTKD